MEGDDPWDTAARIEMARGIVAVQADCSLDDALQMMRDRAAVSRCTLDEIAIAVLDHSIQFGE